MNGYGVCLLAGLSLLTAACQPLTQTTGRTASPRPAACDVFRQLSYNSKRDTAETVKGVREHNRDYGAYCP
jgi:hypothetical protein